MAQRFGNGDWRDRYGEDLDYRGEPRRAHERRARLDRTPWEVRHGWVDPEFVGEFPGTHGRSPYFGSRYGYALGPTYFDPWERDDYPGRYHQYGYGDRRNERGFLDRATDEVSSWFGDEDAELRRRLDHTGKGPRGYRRSDERIHEDVNDRLMINSALDASDIVVAVKDGEVTLNGHVASRWDKRRAEDCADSVAGVTHVQNNLRVRSPEGRAEEKQGLVGP